MSGISEVARLAGVSKSTASRALSGGGYVSNETRARVVQAADRTVNVDGAGPIISVSRFERERNIVRVTGVATDDNRVAQILVDGNRLNITPGRRVDFYAETTGIYADLEVRDAAGNVTKLRAQR